jgi:hypothetical protein
MDIPSFRASFSIGTAGDAFSSCYSPIGNPASRISMIFPELIPGILEFVP